jgi:hypothetical protein
MLKMQIDPEKYMKTKGMMTFCPKKRAILCPKMQKFPGIKPVFREIVRDLCPKTTIEWMIRVVAAVSDRRQRGARPSAQGMPWHAPTGWRPIPGAQPATIRDRRYRGLSGRRRLLPPCGTTLFLSSRVTSGIMPALTEPVIVLILT